MKTLYVEDRVKWRAWLEANSRRATEIWLIHYKKDARRPSLDYGDAVEEAICFGWIDSKIKNLDDARFARLFTPRKPQSRWSPSNIARARKMIAQGKMTPAGIKVYDPRHRTPAHPTTLPAALAAQFRKEKEAWENFQRFPPAYQRLTIGWVASAKQEETQVRRLRQLMAESAANRRIKFMWNPRPANVHFQDRLENGKLVFDYRLRPGVVETTNALALMRSIGLDVWPADLNLTQRALDRTGAPVRVAYGRA